MISALEVRCWAFAFATVCIRDRDRLPRVGVVERGIPAFVNLQLFRSRGLELWNSQAGTNHSRIVSFPAIWDKGGIHERGSHSRRPRAGQRNSRVDLVQHG